MAKYTREQKWKTWLTCLLAYLGLAVACAMCAVVSGCSPRVITETVTHTEYKDSLVYKDTTIFVPIPAESQSNVVLPKDTSHVETSFAESQAWVDTTGLLHHNIRNKLRDWGVQLKYPERTIVSKATTTQHDSIIVEKKVEKDLTWWQEVRLWAFLPLLLACCWAYRSQLAGIVKLLLKFVKI